MSRPHVIAAPRIGPFGEWWDHRSEQEVTILGHVAGYIHREQYGSGGIYGDARWRLGCYEVEIGETRWRRFEVAAYPSARAAHAAAKAWARREALACANEEAR